MFSATKDFIHKNKRYMLASFLIPLFLMAFIYLTIGIYPGSDRSVLASDAFSQFSNFHASFRNMLLGKQSIFYTWNASLGLNYLSLISYYLGGIFTPLVIFFPNQLMPDALYVLTLLKIGSAGLAFWFYASQTFKLPKWNHVILAIFYALMSFVTAHSEIIMWLDAFVYLPLIILGINRLIELRKPKLLFFSYLLLFLSSFYMGFMVAVFSALYFLFRWLRAWKTQKTAIIPYSITALLASGASMIIILPALLDLSGNGEELTQITQLKTEATGLMDLLLKNMVGVYDTTKYGSIPFIYVGLLPLALCLFYFVTKKIDLKDKLLVGSIFAILIASFYLVPLNLFWHGMHAPNMFLFRYAFLFSFLVLMCAGYGWEKLKDESYQTFFVILLLLMASFCLGFGLRPEGKYEYITSLSFLLTIAFLVLYLLVFGLYQLKGLSLKSVTMLLLVFACFETALNTNSMVHGILSDWNYASRSLYTEPYPAISELVDGTKDDNDTFYRLENLDPVSANDSINYGYSGISMFSSIRNRHSSSYLDSLGFRSRGTNLNIRYPNNTLLMDSLLSVKYNISQEELNKYGFEQTKQADDYLLYENNNALPLAILADPAANTIEHYETDNLGNQTNLINGLAGLNQQYFQFGPLEQVSTNNTQVTEANGYTTYTEEEPNLAKEITYKVQVPANTQAYLSLYPQDFAQLDSSSATITVNGISQESQIDITGQYYDLGYYQEATEVEFTVSFYGTTAVTFQTPQAVFLDINAYQTAMDTLAENGVAMTPGNRQATGTINASEDQLLVTTIPYDKGWSAKVDGQKVDVKAFQDAFISFDVPAGKHTVTLSYLPQGFLIGASLFVGCLILYFVFEYYLKDFKNPRKPGRREQIN
ncbi:MAG: YfhO family protein [Enterococcus sp.]